MPGEKNDRSSTVDRLLQTIGGVCLAVAMGIAGWALTYTLKNRELILGNEAEIKAIEASRFTSRDGMELSQAIGDLKTSVAELRSAIPTESPPAWFLSEVHQQGETIELIDSRLDAIEQRLAAMQERERRQ